jgi:hypothetical protein
VKRSHEISRALDSLLLEVFRITRRKLYVRHPQQALERYRIVEKVLREGEVLANELQQLVREEKKAETAAAETKEASDG